MNRLRKSIANASLWSAVFWISFGGAAASTARADEWQVKAGAEAPDMGPQALAFLPNELSIHARRYCTVCIYDPRAPHSDISETRPGTAAKLWSGIRNRGRVPRERAGWSEL